MDGGRNNLSVLAEMVKERVTVPEVAAWFGYDYSGRRRHLCPRCRDVSETRLVLQLFDDGTRWWCYHCGQGGDVIDWVAARLNCRKYVAIENLASRIGVGGDPDEVLRFLRESLAEVRVLISEAEDQDRASRLVMRAAIERKSKPGWCIDWFAAYSRAWGLARSKSAASREKVPESLAFLKSQIVAPQPTLHPAHLRYAKLASEYARTLARGLEPYSSYAARRGWLADDASPLGIGACPRRGDPDGFFDGRIVFPIRDPSARCVGFGGRLIDPEASRYPKAKYINSPDGATYQKSATLYGLDLSAAAIMHAGYVVIVEGYADVAASRSAGIDNVVAPCGGALTHAQTELLSLLTRRAVRAFDADAGGREADTRAQASLEGARIESAAARLPAGLDPDDVVRERGPAALRSAVIAAASWKDSRMDRLAEQLRTS